MVVQDPTHVASAEALLPAHPPLALPALLRRAAAPGAAAGFAALLLAVSQG